MELRDAAISKPDIRQMLPFKPSSVSGVGMNAVPGGCFPLPSEISNLLSRLPPPECFQVNQMCPTIYKRFVCIVDMYACKYLYVHCSQIKIYASFKHLILTPMLQWGFFLPF